MLTEYLNQYTLHVEGKHLDSVVDLNKGKAVIYHAKYFELVATVQFDDTSITVNPTYNAVVLIKDNVVTIKKYSSRVRDEL